jgi:voltage-gated potassium channel
LESSKPWIQGFVPVVRQLKLIRKFQKLQLLLHVLATTMDALKLLLFLGCLIVLVFGCAFYVLEPETMDSLSTSIYLCTVTVTTVGTCDMNPVSPVGKMMAGALCLTSVSRRKVEGLLSLGIIADGDMTHVLR